MFCEIASQVYANPRDDCAMYAVDDLHAGSRAMEAACRGLGPRVWGGRGGKKHYIMKLTDQFFNTNRLNPRNVVRHGADEAWLCLCGVTGRLWVIVWYAQRRRDLVGLPESPILPGDTGIRDMLLGFSIKFHKVLGDRYMPIYS